jgi:hypothetical protein
MTKRNKTIYWVATVWLALGMLSTGIVQLFRIEGEIEFILNLGYPIYFLTILGISKILGVVIVLIPGTPLLKEWAYAGFFFSMAGAIYSHIAMGNGQKEIAPPLLLLVLTILSWYFRPVNRRIQFNRPIQHA